MHRKRDKEIKVRFTVNELKELDDAVKISKLSREAYVRMLIKGYQPRAAPSKELVDTIVQLRKIGNNINQIAMVANKNGLIDGELYQSEYIELQKEINKIMELIS